MKKYTQMSREELLTLQQELSGEYEKIKAQSLSLDMSRGKPGTDQLDLSMGMMDVLHSGVDLRCETGVDCRNYGVIDGIPEAKRLLGQMSEVPPDNIIIYGNSSLNVMFDSIARSMTHGVMGNTPWCKLDKVKFLCPVPGYDRHFKITEFFGIEMINIPMSENGPDMDMVEELVSSDPAVKGIWCVPKYSNPQGYTYSEETVARFARLKPAAPDFRIYWDNAYSIHHLYDDNQDFLVEILGECAKAGNPDIVYKFTSTSKVSFPGSGIAAVAASKANLEDFRKYMRIQTIGHDKVNQLRHVLFFKDLDGLHAHMRKHADLIRPKFELVLHALDTELGELGICDWTRPHGGYFISFDAMEGCAKAIVARAKEAGVILTGAGATYPYGKDPLDSNIRIAPTYPSIEELAQAVKVFVLCVKLCSVEKLLEV
ncbi:MAG: aminotransferase [Blautia sp.]|nr:aminotransferase [Blautia sp.]